MQKLIIEKNDGDQRLDRFLKKYLRNAPLSYIYKAIRKDVKVNGKRAKEDTVLREGDEVSFYVSDDELKRLTAKKANQRAKKQFAVVYEDDNIIVVNKPYGLLTHGDGREKKNTLANQVIDYLIETGAYVPARERTFIPSPVNRVDRNTTGLVIFGKNSTSVRILAEMIRDRKCIRKYYMTIVSGKLEHELHLTGSMLKNERTNTVRQTNDPEGKLMETTARPVMSTGAYTLCEVEIHTGRTHQIRVQMADAGYPLIGDSKYGSTRVNDKVKKRWGLTTQLLHAYKLSFEDCYGELEYLSGKIIETGLPNNFDKIKDDIFGS